MRTGFDSQKYIQLQSERIRERIAQFGGKLIVFLRVKYDIWKVWARSVGLIFAAHRDCDN